MRITNLRFEESSECVRAVANVVWEDCGRPELELYFETPREFATTLRCDANMFLTAAIIPAAYYGERRIHVEGTLCPVLLGGIDASLRQLQAWYGSLSTVTVVESTDGLEAVTGPDRPRAACFLSGGIDSLALLKANRDQLPLNHERSFRDAILIYGADMGCHPEFVTSQRKRFEQVQSRLRDLAKASGLRLIPLETNTKFLQTDYKFWCDWFTGAVMAAVAQSLSRQISDFSLGSPGWVNDIPPCGTHPFIDENCCTAGVSVHHEHAHLRRLEKVRLISDWAEGLANLRVCFHYFYRSFPDDQLNCGRCNRCVYTMLELVAAECEGLASTLPASELSVAHVMEMSHLSRWAAGHLEEVVDPLRSVGRSDLSEAVAARLRAHRLSSGWWQERLKPALRRWDQQMTNGRVGRLARSFRRRG